MEKVLKGRGIDTSEQRVQNTADEEVNKVTITDLEQHDPLGESKHFRLTSPLLRLLCHNHLCVFSAQLMLLFSVVCPA